VQKFLTLAQLIYVVFYFKAQGDKANIADAAEAWSDIISKLPDNVVETDYFKKQLKVGLTDMAAAANIMHPQYKGNIFKFIKPILN